MTGLRFFQTRATDHKPNPLFYLFSKMWLYSVGNRRRVVWFWLMFIAANSILLFGQPLIWAKMMNTVQTQGISTGSIKTLLVLLALTVAIEIAFWLLHGPARFLEETNAFKTRANYRKHLLQGVMTLPLEWHTDHHSGDTIDKIEKGATGLYQFSQQTFQVIYGLVQLIGSYFMLAYFCPPAGIIVVVMVLLTGWITVRFDQVLVEQYHKINHAENNISESVFDAVSNITSVIILRVERLVFDAIVHKIQRPFTLVRRNILINEWKWFLTSMCCVIMIVAVLGMYFWQNFNTAQGVLVGTAYLLIQYLGRVSDQFYQFTLMYGDILQRKSRVANSEELSADFRDENFANHVLPKDWQRLEIKDLNFSYNNDGDDLHLEDVSLTIIRGERIAFVGETGSGKTTLLKVMRDLYHPLGLNLSVDGHVIPHGFESISRAIALVPQDPEIFATTILENIMLGAEYDIEFVRRFTEIACFTDVVESLPHGFNSSIKEKGVNLSGGQQQRLALSRGLLACDNKDIVLLDEPTSSLDAITEMRVYQNIFRAFHGKTIISSIHRLHLLSLFDRVCMFDAGKIIAAGRLNDLLMSCPQFISLWETMQRITTEEHSAAREII
jgi:ABC-type multidrug transport system fused ATPase/permease subunit